jgi:hypothetical protein
LIWKKSRNWIFLDNDRRRPAKCPPPPRLSKSQFTTGLQCHKLLWWQVHEPDAPELAEIDPAMQFIFDQGHEVGRLAQQTPIPTPSANAASSSAAAAAGTSSRSSRRPRLKKSTSPTSPSRRTSCAAPA